MYLKKLELKGFKSFANITEIYLKPGINVVVGPNGCGKSNLVDAIRWALGEGNVRNLRGQKGEDVIFNGTDENRALGMASVEMTIDNTDNILPVDYSEVTVGRKIFRSGESEFILNKSRVRMRDIGELFMGTGLGKRGYSIISQGELEQVLNGQAIDRRLILEEASGVIKYRQQRDEVRKRILDTNQDILRLTDIFSQLHMQEEDLAIKAEKAKKHINLKTELHHLEEELLKYEINKYSREHAEKSASIKKLQSELMKIKAEESYKQEELKENEYILEKMKAEVNSLREELYLIENKQNRTNADIRISQERIKNFAERLKTAEVDENKYEEMLANITVELETRQDDYETQLKAFAAKKSECENDVNKLTDLQTELDLLNEEFELGKENIFTHMEDEAGLRNLIKEKEANLNRLEEKLTRLTIKKEEFSNNINSQQKNYAEIQGEISSLSVEIQDTNENLTNLLKIKENYLLEVNDVLQTSDKLGNELREINNQLLAIRDSEEKLVGYSSAVKKVMGLKHQLPGIAGLIGEVIQVPEGLEVAIETAAGRGLENIIVENSKVAEKVIDYLKVNKAGRVTLLPLDMLRIPNLNQALLKKLKTETGVLGIASELIQYEAKFTKPVSHIFARTLIVEDMVTSVRLFKKYNLPFRIVTLDGEILNTSGAMTGGSTRSNPAYSPLKRKSEEKRLSARKMDLQKKIDEVLDKKANLNTKVNEIETELNRIKSENTEKEFRLELLTKQAEMTKKEWDNTISNRTNLLYEMEELNADKSIFSQEISESHNILGQMQAKNQKTSDELELLRVSIEEKQKDYEVGQARLSSYQDFLATKAGELDNIKHSIEQFTQVQTSYDDSRRSALATKIKLTADIKTEKEAILKLTASKQEYQEEYIKINQDIKSKQIYDDEIKGVINKLKDLIVPLKEDITKIETTIHNHELNLARIETELANLHGKWWDTFNYELPSNLQVNYTNQEIRNFKNRLVKINEELSILGPVDIGAIDEYQVVAERVGFLANQMQDLTQGIEALEELLGKTEKIMLEEFNQFFTMANESFKETFSEIFGGGVAYLAMEDHEDHLAAGVNIEVKMPGKRTQSLSLLSGGERALTCIAFIFALLRLRPAPFCLLDEIDAALDETNLVRFANFLKNMAKDIQFIIITHRQTTIENGDNLYGITMPNKGISTVLTLDLSEAQGLAG